MPPIRALCALAAGLCAAQTPPARLIVLDPAHFHATLLQKEMYPALAARVAVYAPLGPDLLDYLNRISLFNSRPDNPTRWELDVHTSADPLRAMLRDRPGNVVVFSGHNRGKIDRIVASLEAGLNVFADKPWIISSADMPKLERAFEIAESKGLTAYDIMTERFEATSQVQRAFVNAREVFGDLEKGTAGDPAVRATSVHQIMKVVAGVPLRRPAWFFDTAEYGEALADVGPHVVDLVQWTAFPDQAIDYTRDIRVTEGRHWPYALSREQFKAVTGQEAPFTGKFDFYCNNSVAYTIRGVHVKADILWNWEGTGDSYQASFRGTRARVEIRQGAAEKYIPELYVVPASAAVRREVEKLQARWPGLAVEERGNEAHIIIPQKYRVTHEAHFAQVANRFFEYLQSPKSMPAWERPNMLAKYYVTTKGVELAQVSR